MMGYLLQRIPLQIVVIFVWGRTLNGTMAISRINDEEDMSDDSSANKKATLTFTRQAWYGWINISRIITNNSQIK